MMTTSARSSLRRLKMLTAQLPAAHTVRSLHATPAAMAAGDHFDYLVLGAGSGGMASARRAADLYGAKVAIVESGRLGGTCVNVGCVPKKVMWNAAFVKDVIDHAVEYGHNVDMGSYSFDWDRLKSSRDGYVERLNGIYENNLNNSGVTLLRGFARFDGDAGKIVVEGPDGNGTTLTADHILIATGGAPLIPADVPGAQEHGIDSDGFFELETLPKKVAVVGAGYIAVELAGVLNQLGSECELFVRNQGVLRNFDADITEFLNKELVHDGINLVTQSSITKVDKEADGTLTLSVSVDGEESIKRTGYDTLIYAIGRSPAVSGLGLNEIGVNQNSSGHIRVDEYQETGVAGVYALGDVCGIQELTPVAIAAGRRLSDRLFGGPEYAKAKIQYEEVPTVVFSHPPIGTIGLTEAEAIEMYGQDAITKYSSTFVNMYYSPWQMAPADKPKSYVKLVCVGDEQRVVGLHMIGMAADEIVQGFGVGMRMGATKADFDECIAIHPTASEEVVTLADWGKAPPSNWMLDREVPN